MEDNKRVNYIKSVLENMPAGWLSTTTHRLDIYNESLAKTQFLDQLEVLFNNNNSGAEALNELPTAYDYIRLGHPLSCLLEWGIAHMHNLKPSAVISFSSQTVPVLAVLRTNLLANKKTQIVYTGNLPASFDAGAIKSVYGYNFELLQVENESSIPAFEGSTVFISHQEEIGKHELNSNIDFYVNLHSHLGSMLLVNGEKNNSYI